MSTGKNNAWRNKGNDCQRLRELQGEFEFLNADRNICFSSLCTQILAFTANFTIFVLARRWGAGRRVLVLMRALTGKIPSLRGTRVKEWWYSVEGKSPKQMEYCLQPCVVQECGMGTEINVKTTYRDLREEMVCQRTKSQKSTEIWISF